MEAEKRDDAIASQIAVPSEQAWQDLAKAILRKCHGPLTVIGAGMPRLNAILNERRPEMRLLDMSDVLAGQAPFPSEDRRRTVIVADTLEDLDEAQRQALMTLVWAKVGEKGRVILCVPNADAAGGAKGAGGFSRRALKRMMAPLGRPNTLDMQPFYWLVMYADQGREARPHINRRYAVTAALCHGRVLELGSGRGHLCAAVAERGGDVLGIEISKAKVDAARRLYPELTFQAGDILSLTVDDPAFDTVVMVEVLEHVDKETGGRMLDTAWHCVAPGGRLVIGVPNEDRIPHANHVRTFTAKSLARDLSSYGAHRLVAEQPYKWLLMYVDRSD
jgi:2-polyprenyl-3-methyl-5-hydroxy-6-metoxy-1,4-benzoquinol methylase